VNKPTWVIGLIQNGYGETNRLTKPDRLNRYITDPDGITKVPRPIVRPYVQQQTEIRNEVTFFGSLQRGGVNHMPKEGGIASQAKACGKAVG
jgi:hypothetical protein